jgi:uncharacterized lipoprotein YddW (UPF0748 family)
MRITKRIIAVGMSSLLTGVVLLNAAEKKEPKQPVQKPQLKIGVFDRQSTDGLGPSINRLITGLNKNGYYADAIGDFEKLTLLQYDIIYLCNITSFGKVRPGWKDRLKDYVKNGGSVLQSWKQNFNGMHNVPGNPVVKKIFTLKNNNSDDLNENDMGDENTRVIGKGKGKGKRNKNFVSEYGKDANVLLKDDSGKAIAIGYKFAKGKVIITGIPINISQNGRQTKWPKGIEEKVLKSFLDWLKPTIPRTVRLTKALENPSILIYRHDIHTAAGFFPEFNVYVAPGKIAETVKLSCPKDPDIILEKGASLKLIDGPGGTLHNYKASCKTKKLEDYSREILFQAKVEKNILEDKVNVVATYGKPVKIDEKRGLWMWAKKVSDPKKLFPRLRTLGINFIVPKIGTPAIAYYSGSKVRPIIRDHLVYDGDWLTEATKYAHKNGIEIHPYFSMFNLGGDYKKHPEKLEELRKSGRLQVKANGETIKWLCPSQEVNIKNVEDLALEIATKYDVDGIQMDVIRYVNKDVCFCNRCRSLFEKETGKKMFAWPKDVLSRGKYHPQWQEFRRSRISNVVERISKLIRKNAPNVKLSAAVFAGWPGCRAGVAQDWVKWCKEGWLDFVCPMTYTVRYNDYKKWCIIHQKAIPKGFPVIEGIGVTSLAGWMQYPSQLALHIELTRKYDNAGWIIWRHSDRVEEFLETLKPWLETERKQQ